jgi:hypothetical protein
MVCGWLVGTQGAAARCLWSWCRHCRRRGQPRMLPAGTKACGPSPHQDSPPTNQRAAGYTLTAATAARRPPKVVLVDSGSSLGHEPHHQLHEPCQTGSSIARPVPPDDEALLCRAARAHLSRRISQQSFGISQPQVPRHDVVVSADASLSTTAPRTCRRGSRT